MTNPDELKGRVKKAAGEVTDDDKLRREGSADKAAGQAKEAVDKVATKVKSAVGRDKRD